MRCIEPVTNIFILFKGHSEIVRILVNVCNLEALDDHRISPLFVAAQYGQIECLEILVNAGNTLFLPPHRLDISPSLVSLFFCFTPL